MSIWTFVSSKARYAHYDETLQHAHECFDFRQISKSPFFIVETHLHIDFRPNTLVLV